MSNSLKSLLLRSKSVDSNDSKRKNSSETKDSAPICNIYRKPLSRVSQRSQPQHEMNSRSFSSPQSRREFKATHKSLTRSQSEIRKPNQHFTSSSYFENERHRNMYRMCDEKGFHVRTNSLPPVKGKR